MQQLTGLDAAFLALETSSMYGHVGSMCIVDPATAPEPLTLANLTTLIESRLHLIPPFRQRLVEVPLGLDQPYWIEDPGFDIEYHVRELALPAPGDMHQLSEQAARLHARHLDRRRPLWELYLIHGLEDDRMAIYTKVHHAAIDGVSGNDILAAVLDLSPDGRPGDELPPRVTENEPSSLSLLARGGLSLTGHPLRAARLVWSLGWSVPALATSPSRPRIPVLDRLLGDRLLHHDSDAVLAPSGLRAPATPFNAAIGPHRRWAFRSMSLADVKAVKNAAGATVNDVVMALCTGALRHWLIDHDALPAEPLVAAVPVSIRTEEQQGKAGNRISSVIAPLATNVADPVARLHAAHEAMRAAKEQHGALPADLLADVTQFAMPALAGQAARLAARLRLIERITPFNLIISNVPGPDIPLYFAGARLLAYYPLSAIADGQGLNITVMSYGGQLHLGIIVDRDLVPDVEIMADYVVDELDTLLHAMAADRREPA